VSGVPSEGGIEGRAPIVPVEAGILDAMGRRSRGPRLREIRGQTEVPQDPFHRAGVFSQREEPQPHATTERIGTPVPRHNGIRRAVGTRIRGGKPGIRAESRRARDALRPPRLPVFAGPLPQDGGRES
jgi:hypothetical protein